MCQKCSNYFGTDTAHSEFHRNLLNSSGDKASNPIGTTFVLRVDFALHAKRRRRII
jgi:hypothetical protein